MKGNLKKILFVLLAFVAPLAFISCDDEDGDPSTPQKLIAGGRLYYSFSFSQDLLDVATVKVLYYQDGNVKTQTMDKTAFDVESKTSYENFTGGYSVVLVPKGDALDKANYTISCNARVKYEVRYVDGTAGEQFVLSDELSSVVPAENVNLFVTSKNGKIYKFGMLSKDDNYQWEVKTQELPDGMKE